MIRLIDFCPAGFSSKVMCAIFLDEPDVVNDFAVLNKKSKLSRILGSEKHLNFVFLVQMF